MEEFGIGFHCHHETLCEIVEGYSLRVAAIQSTKPASEQPTRLRLFAVVDDAELPSELVPLVQAARNVRAKLEAVDVGYQAKRKALDDTLTKLGPEMEALHARLCPDCPWNGKTIFPQAQ